MFFEDVEFMSLFKVRKFPTLNNLTFYFFIQITNCYKTAILFLNNLFCFYTREFNEITYHCFHSYRQMLYIQDRPIGRLFLLL